MINESTNLPGLVQTYIGKYMLKNHSITRSEQEILELSYNQSLAKDRNCKSDTYDTCLCRGDNVCFREPPGCDYGGKVYADGVVNHGEKCNVVTGMWFDHDFDLGTGIGIGIVPTKAQDRIVSYSSARRSELIV
jgi:hypothetical protein